MRVALPISLAVSALTACSDLGMDARSAAHSRLVENFAARGVTRNPSARADCIVDRLTPKQQGALAVAQHEAEMEAIIAGTSDKSGLRACLAKAGAA